MKEIFLSNSTCADPGQEKTDKLPWEKMELCYRGNVSEMIQIGGGKLSLCAGDPGEPRKPRGWSSEHKGKHGECVDTYEGPSIEPLNDSFSDPLKDPLGGP